MNAFAEKLTRRTLLTGSLAAGTEMLLPAVARAEGLRIACLNWAIVETLIALGHPPVATVDSHGYGKWVGGPALPDRVVDLGSRFEPNMEQLQVLQPDQIFIVPFQLGLRHLMEQVAPVTAFDIFNAESDAFARMHRMTCQVGEIVGRQQEAEDLILQSEQRFDEIAARLRSNALPPVFIVSVIDPHHVRIYGPNSMVHDVMLRLGLRNAWTGQTNSWGFATKGLIDLAGLEAGHMVVVEPLPADLSRAMFEGPLWSRVPAVAHGEFHVIPTVLIFGALPSMLRLAESLEATFASGGTS